MTGTGVASVSERGRGVWKEDVQGTEQAILIQFTNEARPGVRNVGGLVKAALVYKNDQAEVLVSTMERFYAHAPSKLAPLDLCSEKRTPLPGITLCYNPARGGTNIGELV